MEKQLIQFRAGKINKDGNLCTPDTRKGLLRVIQTEDTLVHIQWCERNSSGIAINLEVDTIVFPGEVKVEYLESQRSILVNFPDDSSRNALYWIQEPKSSDFDAESNVEKMNSVLNNPIEDDDEDDNSMAGITPSSALGHAHLALAPTAGSEVSSGSSVGLYPQAPGQMPTAAADYSDMSALAALLGNAVCAGVGGVPRSAESPAEEFAQALLKQLAAGRHAGGVLGEGGSGLLGLGLGPSSSSLASSSSSSSSAQTHPSHRHPGGGAGRLGSESRIGPLLHHVLTPEVLGPILKDPAMLRRLLPFLPESQRDAASLSALAASPQFQQQLAAFATALASGHLDPQQFGLPEGTGLSVEGFLQAIEDAAQKEKGEGEKGEGGEKGEEGEKRGDEDGDGEGEKKEKDEE